MQNSQNVYMALKAETTPGVKPVVVTGAKKFPINRMTAPTLEQATIRPGRINSDGQMRRARGGSHRVSGSPIADLIFGVHDDVLQAALRSPAWATDVLTPGTVSPSYCVEIAELDDDISTLSLGCGIGGYIQRGAPDQPITHEYPLVGFTQEVLTGASSPFYPTPAEASEDYMTTVDAAIEIDASPVAIVTGWETTVPNGAAGLKVVGSKYTPKIFYNNLDLTGSISMVRDTATMQQKYIANTPVDLVITASDLAGNLMIFRYRNLLLGGFTQPLGEDGAEVVTIPFTGGKYGSDPIVEIERTAAA